MSNIKNKLATDYVADLLRDQGYEVTNDGSLAVILTGGTKVDVKVASRWSGSDDGERWWVTDADVAGPREDLIFVFVNAIDDDLPVWIMPSRVVAKAVVAREVAWKAADPDNRHGAENRKRLDPNTDTQNFGPDGVPGYPPRWLDRYREAWVVIDLVEHMA